MTTAKLVLQEIVEKMKSAECENYLRPPILFCENNTSICGSCKDETSEEIVGTNDQLESIGNLLKFPCRYNTFGCKIAISWAEAEVHESECPFRQFTCPKCTWSGKATDMKTHVQGRHENMLLPNLTSNFSLRQNKDMFFIISMEELYILLFDCDTDSGLLWFTLQSVGPVEQAKRRHFKLILKQGNSVEYYERKQVEPAVDWEIDEDSAIKIDLCVLRMKLQLKSESVVKLHIEVHSRTPLYNGSVDEGLLEDVECPVCQDYMNTPIYQCIVGHSICNYCKPKLKCCPVCKSEMSESRNFALESVCSKMFYKCMYSDDGCIFASLPKDIFDHENNCDFGFFDCPFKTFIANCTWRGKMDQMSSHTLEEHGWKFQFYYLLIRIYRYACL